MSMCKGTRNGSSCGMLLYRCVRCGHVGCNQVSNSACSNMGFNTGRCVRCGNSQTERIR
ncbi:hypothetical protein PCA31118_02435 [Pandoraea captiosa]|uniref:Uncharacterized protein n=1 Tax=Pandoraea captiosa TaxID=2508302 RepID=A0A5E5A2J6_9BURK|nr:hypothetical protein PCA31118_02435 [Pandoraea captiosa]